MSFNQINRVPDEPSHSAGVKVDESAIEHIDNVPEYKPGDVESLQLEKKVTITDPVFGEIYEDGPNYRNVGWVGAAALMTKTQVGIGVLSIPRAFDILGLVPGIFTLLAISVITTWSDYIVGCFKRRHPEVYGIDDAGGIMCGRLGRFVLREVFFLYWVFVTGSAILSFSIGLNAVSEHGTCTAAYVAVGAVACFIFTSIPTLSKVSWLAAGGAIAILISIFTLTIAVGVQDRPAAAPQSGPFTPDVKAVADPTFAELMSAVAMIVFAFSGTPAFFPIAAEMRNPRHYTRSMLICQAIVTTVYLVIGVVVYCYCGSYVASPALGSAGALMKKVCYGIALPGLLVTEMIVSHFPAKMLLVRFLGGTKHMTANTFTHWATWLGCTSVVTLAAYIIASAVPKFDSLIALIGALLGPPICLIPFGYMWIHDNWTAGRKERTWHWRLMTCWSVFVIAVGCFIMVAGTYGAVIGLIKDYSGDGGAASWSCVDNSNST